MAETSGVDHAGVHMRWNVRIPMRDGVRLNATLYLPENHAVPSPVIFTLTPYIGQTHHDRGCYFAAHGYPFLTVDVRGRGDSEGIYKPFVNEARDGHDVVEWLSQQPYCNGQVAMWGGSNSGYNQWATAKEFPAPLASIVPVASGNIGVDFPMRGNVPMLYAMQWLIMVSGRTSQANVFGDRSFWCRKFKEWFEAGLPFKQLDTFVGRPSADFQEWIAHPRQDSYWDSFNPTAEQYAKLSIPILTITGIYDGDQPGALKHYREHLKHCSISARARHYLVIGPWDHSGTRTPKREFAGITVGPASLIDLPKLHLQWYAWTTQRGPRPDFLQKNVAYYVMGAEKWRYADTLEAVTARSVPFYLQSTTIPVDVFSSGSLASEPPLDSASDRYVYDPRDVSHAELESSVDSSDRADQRLVHISVGRHLVYHSEPFAYDTEVSGFFKLSVWLSIDQPDTDFSVSVHDIGMDGGSVRLTDDVLRARHRESLREDKLIQTTEPLRYDFDGFMFVARTIKKGHRLRLVIGPLNSIYRQKNYNSGGVVAEESMQDARVVSVKLFHDRAHPSALYVPLGQTDAEATDHTGNVDV